MTVPAPARRAAPLIDPGLLPTAPAPVPRARATCAADCGHCCDPVKLGYHPHRLAGWQSANIATVVARIDPATDEGWAGWLAEGFTDAERDMVIRDVQPGSTRQRNADFMNRHWTVITGDPDPLADGFREVHCDVYDPATRRCGAYSERPPICADYPHYGEPLREGDWLPPVCSYNAEVRTMLPIVEIRSGP